MLYVSFVDNILYMLSIFVVKLKDAVLLDMLFTYVDEQKQVDKQNSERAKQKDQDSFICFKIYGRVEKIDCLQIYNGFEYYY